MHRYLRHAFVIFFLLAVATILLQNGFCLAVLLGLLLWKLFQTYRIPHFTFFLFVCNLSVGLFLTFTIHPPIISDFFTLFDAAQKLLAGDTSFQHSTYFTLWAYQTGPVIWEAFWLSLYNSPVVLQISNLVLSSGILCLLYQLIAPYVSAQSAQTAIGMLALFPFYLTMPLLLSNQIPSAFFFLLGVWFLQCPKFARLGPYRAAISGLLLALGNILRPEGVIILVALLAWCLFHCTKNKDRSTIRRTCGGMLLLLAVYAATLAGASACVQKFELNEFGLANNAPKWKLITGLNPNSDGSYSQADWEAIAATLENGRPTDATEAVEDSLLRRNLSASPRQIATLFTRKIRALWCADALHWALGHTQSAPGARPKLYALIVELDRGIFYLALGLSAFGLLFHKRCAQGETHILILYLIPFSAFCAFLFVESQARYAYLPQLFLFSSAALGLDLLGPGQVARPCLNHIKEEFF